MIKLILLSLLIITGCASTTKEKQELIVNTKTKEVFILPIEDMKKCEDLKELQGKKIKYLFQWGIETSEEYYKCSKKQEELSNWILRNHSEK